MSPFQFEKVGNGRYRVIDRETDDLLGVVWKFEVRYNLRRTYVSRGWTGKAVGGEASKSFRTRVEAANFLKELSESA